jgi:hypothetical protein
MAQVVRENHIRTIKTLAENRSENMTRKVDKDEYQDLADCIRMDQVPAKDIADFFSDKAFYKWYKKKYL